MTGAFIRVEGGAPPCVVEFTRLREEFEKKGIAAKAASQRHASHHERMDRRRPAGKMTRDLLSWRVSPSGQKRRFLGIRYMFAPPPTPERLRHRGEPTLRARSSHSLD
jgi:hypothetical protein